MALLRDAATYFHSQFFVTPPYPTRSFGGSTVLVTGASAGLGLEAARHFVRLNAAKVIMAVRSAERGAAAANSISQTTGRSGVVEVWEVDLASYASVTAFAARVDKTLDRLDVVVGNAGVSILTFTRAEDNETMTTVNFVNTMLLGLLLLPKLRQTSVAYKKEVVLTFTGSFLHAIAAFPENDSDDIMRELADESKANMHDRYAVVKLMLLMSTRELASRLTQSDKGGEITVSYLNPNSVKTNMGSDAPLPMQIFRKVAFRKTEVGSRTLVLAAQGGSETHGQYLNNGKLGRPSALVRSEEGQEVQRRLWGQLMVKLESIHPGIEENI